MGEPTIPILPDEILELVRSGMPHDLIVLERSDVARILKLHPSAVGKLAARGKLREFRTGPQDGTPRTTLTELLAYIRGQLEAGAPVVHRLPRRVAKPNLRPVPDGAVEPWHGS